MFVKILRIREIEVAPIGASLRVQWIIMRILYTQQIKQEGEDELTLGVASRAVKIRVLFDDFPDAEIHGMPKTGESVAYIATILEGQRLILRFEFT